MGARMLKPSYSHVGRSALWLIAATLLVLSVCAAYLLMSGHNPFIKPLAPDETLLQAYRNAVQVHSYAENVDTEVQIAGRILSIRGLYLVDDGNLRYASVATTTLIDPGSTRRQSFTVHNISIGSDVYSLISTPDDSLREAIRADATWHHYKSTAIPADLSGIVIAGPILDNLKIMSQNGAYLTLIAKKAPDPKTHLAPYTFTLSPVAPQAGGVLETLAARIGSGTIHAWIDVRDSTVRQLAFNAANYHSTTTFSRFNEDLPIEAPPQAH